jgi:hypothetical protein
MMKGTQIIGLRKMQNRSQLSFCLAMLPSTYFFFFNKQHPPTSTLMNGALNISANVTINTALNASAPTQTAPISPFLAAAAIVTTVAILEIGKARYDGRLQKMHQGIRQLLGYKNG